MSIFWLCLLIICCRMLSCVHPIGISIQLCKLDRTCKLHQWFCFLSYLVWICQIMRRNCHLYSATPLVRVKVQGEMHLKDLLGSFIRVGYCIPVPDFLSSATWPSLPKKHYNGLNQVKVQGNKKGDIYKYNHIEKKRGIASGSKSVHTAALSAQVIKIEKIYACIIKKYVPHGSKINMH